MLEVSDLNESNSITKRLETDGDDFEKIGWDLFVRDKFPNYEKFWQKFVFPKRDENSIHHKSDLEIIESELIMLHYSIFRNFFLIYNKLSGAVDFETFENCYSRLSSILDLTEEFLMKYAIFEKKLDLDLILNDFQDRSVEFNINDAKKSIEKGKPYSVSFLSKIELAEAHYSAEMTSKFKNKSREIRTYRNKVIHSWQRFIVILNGLLFVAKKETVTKKEFSDWAKVYDKIKEKDTVYIKKNFISAKALIENEVSELVIIINNLWNEIISEL